MKKIAGLIGAAVLASGSIMTSTSIAADAPAANSAQASTYSTALLATANGTEGSQRSAGVTDDKAIVQAIVQSITNEVLNEVRAGATADTISTAMNMASNTPGLSKDVAAAFGVVNGELAALTENAAKTGSVGAGTGAGNPDPNSPNPPAPAIAGTGYVS